MYRVDSHVRRDATANETRKTTLDEYSFGKAYVSVEVYCAYILVPLINTTRFSGRTDD